jgi:hypothetical protein
MCPEFVRTDANPSLPPAKPTLRGGGVGPCAREGEEEEQ